MEKTLRGNNHAERIHWLQNALRVAQALGAVVAADGKTSTGIVLKDQKLLTIYHLLDEKQVKERLELNYREFKGEHLAGKVLFLDWPFFSNEALNYTFASLKTNAYDYAQTAEAKDGFIPISADDRAVRADTAVFVLSAEGKQNSLLSGQIKSVAALTFTVEVEGGGRLPPGSPVLNTQWELIGMVDGQSNRALKISAVAEDLKKQGFTLMDMAAKAPSGGGAVAPAPAPVETPKTPTAAAPPASDLVKFVVLCDPADEKHAKKLSAHLNMLRRRGKIALFLCPFDIPPGEMVSDYADKEIAKADYLLCLVTVDFLNGPWFETTFAAFSSGKKTVPILVNRVDLEGSGLEKLRSLPSQGRTIASFSDEDIAYTDIVAEIRRLLPG